jgi:hypothetical protein
MNWDLLLKEANPWLELGGSALVALTIVGLAQLTRRLVAGAGLLKLARNGFRECPPLQASLRYVSDAIVIAMIGAVALLGRAICVVYQLRQEGREWSQAWLLRGGVALVSLLGLAFLIRVYRSWRSNIRVEGTPVEVQVQAVTEGVAPADLKDLGAEAFPNRAGSRWRTGLVARHLILWTLVMTLAWWASIWIWDLARLHDDPAFGRWPVPKTGSVLGFMASLREILVGQIGAWPPWFPAVAYLNPATFLVFLPANRSYLLLSAPSHAILLGATAVGSVLAALHLGGAVWGTRAAVAAQTLLAWRCSSDLSRDRRNSRRQSFLEPIRRETVARCPWLSRIPAEMAANYPELDLRELARRVSQGALNLEEATPWVTRNFGRFVRRPQVAHRRCASAILRYLTVNRSARFARSWSTRAPLYCKRAVNPMVPNPV